MNLSIFLLEGTQHKETMKVTNKIRDYFLEHKIYENDEVEANISVFFKEFNFSNVEIILKYEYNKTEMKFSARQYNSEKKIELIISGKYEEGDNIFEKIWHEVIHIFDFLKSPSGNTERLRKSYKRSALSYLSNTYEFNQLITKTIGLLKDQEFRVKMKLVNTYEQLIDLIIDPLPEYRNEILKDVFFKKRLLNRLYREGITINIRG